LHTREGKFKKTLEGVKDFKISHNYFSQIKTTARFSMLEDKDIDYLNDQIRPYILISEVKDGGYTGEKETTFMNLVHVLEFDVFKNGSEGEWVEYPLGAFFMSSPKRRDTISNVMRDIEAYDLSLALSEDRTTDRLFINKGTEYYDIVRKLMEDSGVKAFGLHIDDGITLRRDIEYEPGTSILTVINDLLGQVGNTPIFMDNKGVLRTIPYINPTNRRETFTYDGREASNILVGAEEELDLFNAPNVFTVAISNPDEEPVVRTVVNDDPFNPLSTVRRGRRIVDFRTVEDMSSEDSLEKYVVRIANEANVQFGTITFRTPLTIGHWYGEVVKFVYPPLGINGKFLESGWEMDLRVGGEMTHTLRQVINFSEEKEGARFAKG